MSQKSVDTYRRENPGSKLQTAVTGKNPTGKDKTRRRSSVPVVLMVKWICTISIALKPQIKKSAKHVDVGGAD